MKMKERFLEKFEKFFRQEGLIENGDKILVGFSGGADSTALLLCLSHLKSKYNISILAAHINYNLRGDDSVADENFVKDFCFRRNISLVIKNVKSKITGNLENEARKIRMKYFRDLQQLYKIDKIALGHQKNDQTETVLFRLIRGSGLTGLKGISPRNKMVIHPLLPFSKKEIKSFLNAENVIWREDKSNLDNNFSRNIIRNELLPWIRKKMNPKIDEKIFHLSEIFSETDKILEATAKRRLNNCLLKHSKEMYQLSLKNILKTPKVVRFYIYRQIFEELSGGKENFYHGDYLSIESILNSEGGKKIDLPHQLIVQKIYQKLIFGHADELENLRISEPKLIPTIRNRIVFDDYRISMKKLKKLPHSHYPFEDKNIVYLDFDEIVFPLIFRHRRNGDKFFPFGMNKQKKLKDFFIDEKISKFDRDRILILSDKEKILWIGGMRIDNRVGITDKTNNILMVKIEKIALQKARHAERIKSKNSAE